MSETDYTRREKEVKALIDQKLGPSEIAARLGISLRAFRIHRDNINRKDRTRAFFEDYKRRS